MKGHPARPTGRMRPTRRAGQAGFSIAERRQRQRRSADRAAAASSCQPSTTRPISGPPSRLVRRETCGRHTSRCVRLLPDVRRSSCSWLIGFQRLSITSIGSRSTWSTGSSRCSGPEPKSRAPGQLGIVGDEVHLGVVEERVLVEVRGADRQPAIVDDPDLGVDVDRIGPQPRAGEDRRGEDPSRPGVRLEQLAEDAARVVDAGIGFHGQEDEDPEVLRRRIARSCRRGPTRSPATRGTGSRGR